MSRYLMVDEKLGVLTAGQTQYGLTKAWYGNYNGSVTEIGSSSNSIASKHVWKISNVIPPTYEIGTYNNNLAMYSTTSNFINKFLRFQYSTSVNVSDSGAVDLSDTNTFYLSYGTSPTNSWNVLVGKYIKRINTDSDINTSLASGTIYYIASDGSVVKDNNGYYYGFTANKIATVTGVAKRYETAGYIDSDSSDTYPSDGTIDSIYYKYLGQLGDSLL